jgi:hypothetical protein
VSKARERVLYEGHSGYARQRPFVARTAAERAREREKRVKTQGEKLLYCVCERTQTHTHTNFAAFLQRVFI